MLASTTSRGLLFALAAAGLVLAAPAAFAGHTPWFDRDDPSGVGDYEDTVNLFQLRCRLKGVDGPAGVVEEGKVGGVATPGYHCKLPTGGWCVNAETAGGNSCKDIEVRYSWP
jgi:hypothetical protein